MAFTLPTFNIVVAIWRAALDPHVDPPSATSFANFNLGRRVVGGDDSTHVGGVGYMFRYLLTPKGTDIRGPAQTGGADFVEIPSGSGFFYELEDNERCALGFPNEYIRSLVSPAFIPMNPFP